MRDWRFLSHGNCLSIQRYGMLKDYTAFSRVFWFDFPKSNIRLGLLSELEAIIEKEG